MFAFRKRLFAVATGLALALGACDFKLDPPAPSGSTDAATDSGVYDCTKFARYRKLCPNDVDPIESPKRLCENRVNHPKCGDLGAEIMECLWGLQSRKDMCGADGVTISGKVTAACGQEDSADDTCRAQNP